MNGWTRLKLALSGIYWTLSGFVCLALWALDWESGVGQPYWLYWLMTSAVVYAFASAIWWAFEGFIWRRRS